MKLLAYLINLDRDGDRHVHMAQEFSRIGVLYHRVDAVLGLAMPDWVKPYFLFNSAVASNLKTGEVGCYASHLVVAKTLLDSDLPYALICEDDLVLPDDLSALLAAALESLPADWDILRLSNPAKAPYRVLDFLPEGRALVLYARVPNNTGCHLLSRAGAQKLLVPGLRRLQIDEHLRRPWQLGMANFGIEPAPVLSNIFDSTIDKISDRGLALEGWIAKTWRRERGNPLDWFRQIRWLIRYFGVSGVVEALLRSLLFSGAKGLKLSNPRRFLRMKG